MVKSNENSRFNSNRGSYVAVVELGIGKTLEEICKAVFEVKTIIKI